MNSSDGSLPPTGINLADRGAAAASSVEKSSLADWTAEQIAQGKRWVKAWEEAGKFMAQLRRQELRRLDVQRTIALLCGPADYRVPPRAPKPTSGLIEQQRWFMKAASRD